MPGNTADRPPDPPPWSSAAAAIRLRDLLDQRGLTIASLARALAVTRQTIHRWLQGQHISPANLQRLSEYFQVDIVWLQSGTEADPQGRSTAGGDGSESHGAHLEIGAQALRLVTWDCDLASRTMRWGGSVDPVLGDDIRQLSLDALLRKIHDDDRDRAMMTMQSLIEGDASTATLELRFNAAQPTRWMEVAAQLERDADGNPQRLIGTLRDVSQRKKLESDLVAARRMLDRLQTELPITLFLVDAEGGLTSLAPTGAHPSPRLDHPAGFRQAIEKALTGTASQCSEGDLFMVASPFDAEDEPRRALVMLIDISHLAATAESAAS